ALTLLAESERTAVGEAVGTLPSWGNGGPVILFSRDDASISVLTPQLKELARFAGQYEYVEPLEYDDAGNIRSVVAGAGNSWAMLTDISRRSFGDYVGVVYIDYQNYILACLSAALAALLVVNIYRRRTKRNLRTISQQKAEIEDAHRALQDAQEAIIAQEKYRQAKDIAGGFAHEIRNALFPAEASLQRLRSLGAATEFDRAAEDKYARSASEAVSRAIRITQLISLYTKLDSEYLPERVEVARVVAEAVRANRERAQDQGIAIQVDGPAGLFVEINAQQFFMVINNFVLNSLDALTARPEPRILVTSKADLGRLTLTCEDNGSGIADADLPKVFDAFFSTKPSKGTGLGLAISKKIIELYGGTISAAGRPGEGAKFTVTLKLVS
ncbi:MAG TPA: HAMP domain-containing sensor histidine kinase, partial [Candidatus Acidoferrum sp.]|nr:HAMP domain-containing sensor histidine kinase [Candidatus Acidoferrum sp.]